MKSRLLSGSKIQKYITAISLSIFRYAMLFIIGYIVLYPLIYMISGSLKSVESQLDVNYIWVPREVTFEFFKTAFEYLNFTPSLLKTISLQMVSAFVEVFVCAFVAYGFARFNFKCKNIAIAVLMLTLMIPMPMYSMSLAINYKQLDFFGLFGLLNNLTGLDLRLNIFDTDWCYWLPSIFGVGIRSGMLIYIYIQFFKGLPRELEDTRQGQFYPPQS